MYSRVTSELQQEAHKHYGPSEVVSRAILAPHPGLQNLPGPDVGKSIKLILLYIFVYFSASKFFG
jgi:hypothetical protein